MDTQLVYNLIIYYFSNINLSRLNVISCWSSQDRFHFSNLTSSEWIFVRHIRLSVDDYIRSIQNLCEYGSGELEGFVFDYACSEALQVLEELSNWRCFTMTRYWLIYETTTYRLLENLKDTNLSIDAHITYTKSIKSFNGPSGVFDLYDVYNNGKELGGLLNVSFDETLDCSAYEGLGGYIPCRIVNRSQLGSMSFFRNRALMSDITMRISTVLVGMDLNQSNEILLKYLDSIDKVHVNNIGRYGYRFALLLKDVFGYNVSWSFLGMWTETFTSGGALSQIELGQVDQVSTPFAIVTGRLTDIWVAFEGTRFRTSFFFLTSNSSELTGYRFVKPFQGIVWFCVLGMVAAFSIGLKNIFILERQLRYDSLFIPSYLSTILSGFGTLCQQSSLFIPRSSGGRISYIFFLVSTFLLYNYYTSLIVAFLLGSQEKSNIKELTQLADSDLQIGIEDVAYTRAFLTFQEPRLIHFLKRKVEPVRDPKAIWVPIEEGMKRTRGRGYAYHCEVSLGYFFMEQYYTPNEICDLNMVDLQPQKSLGFFIKKGSPYHNFFKIKYLWIRETGHASKHVRYWFKRKPPCLARGVINTVGIGYAAPLFLILVIGIIVSVLLLLIEICFEHIAERSHR